MKDKLVFDEINERDMREAPDVVTALDETIPSPARIQMTETVELPEIQTMTGYYTQNPTRRAGCAVRREAAAGNLTYGLGA